MSSVSSLLPVSPRIERLAEKRRKVRAGLVQLNVERSVLYTDYYRKHEAQYPVLKRAGAMYHWCEQCSCNVFDDEIIVGSLGPAEESLSIYVEWIVSWLDKCVNDDDESFRLAWQSPSSVYMSDDDRRVLQDIVSYWRGHTISDYLLGVLPEEIW